MALEGLLGKFATRVYSFSNFVLGTFFNVRLSKSREVKNKRKARQIFRDCRMHFSPDGYWFLKPMPSSEDLIRYYASNYWSSRGGKPNGVTIRDLIHYQILNCKIPEMAGSERTFLNFGAGHAGVSHLLWMGGLSIVNIEPSRIPEFYDRRWTSMTEITGVPPASVDIVYGSHSLEHVNDLDFLKKEIVRVLKPGGYCFIEVPNALYAGSGAQRNEVDIPHTYYFTTRFFEDWFDEVLLCDTFNYSEDISNWHEARSENGRYIRAFGRLRNVVQ